MSAPSATQSSQLSPGSSAPGRPAGGSSWFGRFTQTLNVIGTILILVMAVAVNADVVGRGGFNSPIAGVTEFIGLSIVAVVFLQMANTLREERHVSNDVFIRLAGEAYPRVVAGLYCSYHLIGAGLMFIVVIYVWPILRQNYEGGYFAGTAGVVQIPIWPFMAIVVLGAATTTIQFLIDSWTQFMRAWRGAQG